MHGEDEIVISRPFTMRVHVFKTNVRKQWQAEMLCEAMAIEFPFSKCNFDLQDIDKIFRIESYDDVSLEVIALLKRHGFDGEEL